MAINKTEKALDIFNQITEYTMGNLNWYFRLKPNDFATVFSFVEQDILVMREVMSEYQQIDPESFDKYIDEFSEYYSHYVSIMKFQQEMQPTQENY